MRRITKRKIENSSRNIYLSLVYLFLFLPILMVVVFSFNDSKMNITWHGFTTDWYVALFSNDELMEALINTMIIAVVSTIVSTTIGTMAAVGLKRYQFKGKQIIDNLLYVPVVIPEIVLGISLLSVYSIAKLPLGLLTIILSHITFSVPFVIITVRSRLSGFDVSVEEAAMDLGANRFKTFTKVTLPMIAPGVISGMMLAFTLSLDDVVISFFTAGPGSNTLPLKIFSMVKTGVSPDVNALSTIIMLVTLLGLGIVTLMQVKAMKKIEG